MPATQALEEVSDTGVLSALPRPVDVDGQGVTISGLTCPTVGHCFGLGETGVPGAGTASHAGATVAETYDGTAFAAAFTGLPLRLGGFTCRPEFCMLVGSHARMAASARWDWPPATSDAG